METNQGGGNLLFIIIKKYFIVIKGEIWEHILQSTVQIHRKTYWAAGGLLSASQPLFLLQLSPPPITELVL